MALEESALSELLDALRVGDGTDLIRDLAGWALQQLIEAEASAVIGAGRFERNGERVTHRNGYRRRVLSTKAGDLDVGIPKLRKGSFFPEILEPRRRIDQALYSVVMEAYVNGVSTRAVDDLVAAMGVDTGISKSESRGSAPVSTSASPRSATEPSGMSRSPTCTSTRRTSTSATTPSARSCPARS